MATETTSELPSPSAPYVPKPFPVVGVAASSNGLPTRKQPFSSHTPTPSQLQLSSDGSQVRAGSLDSSQARSSAFAAGPDMLTAKSSLLAMHMARQESKSSTSSLTSSNILTNVATAPSSLGSLTSDQRAQRTLPPISSLGLETRDSPGRSPGLTAQSVPFLKPSFSTSDSSSMSPRLLLPLSWAFRVRHCTLYCLLITLQLIFHSCPTKPSVVQCRVFC